MSGALIAIIVLTLLGAGDASPTTAPATAPATQPAAELSKDDEQVINLCLAVFRSHDDSPFARPQPLKQQQLIVHRLTNEGGNWYLSQDQLDAEERQVRVPKELIRALNERAERTSKRSLDQFKPEDARVIVGDLEKLPRQVRFMALEKVYPEARAYVTIWLPAYDANRERAIFRLFFGPSAHGASASFLLRKGADGQWVVYAAQLSYYA